MNEILSSPNVSLGLNNLEIVEEEVPAGIVEYLQRSAKGYSNYTEGKHREKCFWVTDICKCLRQSYYNINGIVPDTQKSGLRDLWSIQSGKYLHDLTYSYRWRELDMEKEFLCEDIEETLTIRGRLDMYDYKAGRIIDLKTTNAVKWQQNNGFIPRQSDILQLQCYGSLFQGTVKVSKLTLVYADMKDMLAFGVRIVDMSSWMKERIRELYTSIAIRKTPPCAEPSDACNYCKFKTRCAKLEKLDVNSIGVIGNAL